MPKKKEKFKKKVPIKMTKVAVISVADTYPTPKKTVTVLDYTAV